MRIESSALLERKNLGAAAAFVPDSVTLEKQTTSAGAEYTLSLGEAFAPEQFYTVLETAAPAGDDDFHRPLWMIGKSPTKTRRTPKNSCAATLACPVGMSLSIPVMEEVLDRADLHEAAKDVFRAAVAEHIDNDTPSRMDATIKTLAESLHELPDVTEAIIQTLLPMRKYPFAGRFSPRHKTPQKPSALFKGKYSMRLVSDGNGIMTVEAFEKTGTHLVDNWFMPKGRFKERQRDGATYLSTPILDPYSHLEPNRWATLEGSVKSGPKTPGIVPEIRWVETASGARDFVRGSTEKPVVGRHVFQSGVFGVVLAAALQPEVSGPWSGLGRLESGEGAVVQDMGIAQVPVLALGKKAELVNGPLLRRAEALLA